MKRYSALLISVTFFLVRCNNNQSASNNIQTADTSKVAFFPVTSFLRGQAAELDSLQSSILYTTNINGKIDSAWEKRENIRKLLQPFFAEEINESNLTSLFKPTKFHDQTIDAVTFTYDALKPLPDSISLRHWDIYINPETGKIKKIYILRAITENGKNFIQQLTWQTDKWAKIILVPGNPADSMLGIKEETIRWRFD